MPLAAELRDGDLLLRPFRDGDDEEIGVDLRLEPFMGLPPEGPPPERDPDAPAWAIAEGGRAVGRIWMRPHRRPFEVGYALHPDARGRGLATRALVLVRDYMGEPLELFTHPLNTASQRVAERAGFRRDGVVENYARFRDGESTALKFVWP
ncbi:MAG TPA: GNAT family N-acetyltransferase [Gaiellaceae bacterium]